MKIVQVDVFSPFITVDQTSPKHLNPQLSESKLQQLVGPLGDRTNAPCERCGWHAGFEPHGIKVRLVSGSTRLPLVKVFV